jgi:Spy/CpxP family protein refolding chaperone
MGMAHGAMSEHMVGRMVERLDLSDEQRDRLFAAIDAARPQMRSLGFDLMDNHRALRDLQPGAEGYQEQVAELARRQGELMERMIVARAGLKEQLRGVLTPEQAARFDEMHQDLHDRHGGRHGKGRDASSS